MHATQSKANTNKADEASPFSLLIDAATARATTNLSKKDKSDSGDKPADDKAVAKKDSNQDDNNQPQQTQASVPAKPVRKAEKSGKDEAVAEAARKVSDSQVDSVPVAATDAAPANPQAQPLVPVIQAVAAAGIEDLKDLQIDAPAASAPAVPAPAAAPTLAASPTLSQTPAAPAAAAPALADAPAPAETAAQAPADAATPTGKPSPDVAQADSKDVQDNAPQKDAAAQSLAAQFNVKQPAPRDSTAKPATAKVAANDKAASKNDPNPNDTIKNDASKSTDAKPAPQQAETFSADASAPKPAAPQPQAINTNLAVHDIAGAQAPLPTTAAAPVVTQHVLLAPQAATPNVPALAVEIAAKSQSGAKQFDIRLDPPELGRVEVRLSIDATGKASAHLSADQPQTLHLLQKDAPALTRALREAGLDVSQDGLNFSLRQQGNGQEGGANDNNRRGSSRSFSLGTTSSIDATASTAAWRGRSDGRLDIRI